MGQFKTALKIRRRTNFQSTKKNMSNSALVFLKPNTEMYWHQSPQIFSSLFPDLSSSIMEITLHLSMCKCAYYCITLHILFCYLLLGANSSPAIEKPVGKATWLLPVVLYTFSNPISFSASHTFFEMPRVYKTESIMPLTNVWIIISMCIGTTTSQTYCY